MRPRLRCHYPLQIVGANRDGTRTLVSRNPTAPDEALGEVELAGEAQALQTIANARSAFPVWRDTPVETREQPCLRAAGLMLERRFEPAACSPGSPGHLELARARFRVDNLYPNRRITGALVAVQPFGGWHLSGTGIQAGGPIVPLEPGRQREHFAARVRAVIHSVWCETRGSKTAPFVPC